MVASHFERVIGHDRFEDDAPQQEVGARGSKPKNTRNLGELQESEQLGDTFFGGSGAKSHRGEGFVG